MEYLTPSRHSTQLFETAQLPATIGLDPLLERLERACPQGDFSALLSCVVEQLHFERDQVLRAENRAFKHLHVISSGFAFDFSVLLGRKRHIFDFYGPGGICDWRRPERDDVSERLLFKARSEVTVIDRARLSELLAGDIMLGRAFKRLELVRARRLMQRVRAFISLPAKERLRFLLLDLVSELGAAEEKPSISLPFTQEEVGDLIGSTSVHVSRTFSTLENAGEIERRGNNIQIVDIHAMRARLGYRRFSRPSSAEPELAG